MTSKTPYERILSVFEGKGSDRVPWNIRHEFWYHYNFFRGTLPAKYAGMRLIDICLEWGASWRCYSGYFTDSFVKVSHTGDVEIKAYTNGRIDITEFKTPEGTLRQASMRDKLKTTSRIIEFPVKSLEDLKPLKYILENLKVEFDEKIYNRMERELKGQGMVSYFFPQIALSEHNT